jgi:hypothetical protein
VVSHGLLPQLLPLIRVHISFPGAALDEGGECLLDLFTAHYVHYAPFFSATSTLMVSSLIS